MAKVAPPWREKQVWAGAKMSIAPSEGTISAWKYAKMLDSLIE